MLRAVTHDPLPPQQRLSPPGQPRGSFLERVQRFFRSVADALGGTRKRRLLSAGVVGLLVLALVGGTAVSLMTQAREAQAAEEAREARAAAAEVEQEREAAEELADARQNRERYLVDADERAAEAASYAEPAALEQLGTDRAILAGLADSTDAKEISAAVRDVLRSMNAVGSEADAQDRKYLAAREAAGKGSALSETSSLSTAKLYCSDLLSNYGNDPQSSYTRFADGVYDEDLQAVQIYCPQFQAGIDYASRAIPEDSGLAVGDAASPLDASPRVIAAGTYKTTGAPSDCYYEINNQRGSIITNNFVNSAPGGLTVTLRPGQGFDSQGCGIWLPQ